MNTYKLFSKLLKNGVTIENWSAISDYIQEFVSDASADQQESFCLNFLAASTEIRGDKVFLPEGYADYHSSKTKQEFEEHICKQKQSFKTCMTNNSHSSPCVCIRY